MPESAREFYAKHYGKVVYTIEDTFAFAEAYAASSSLLPVPDVELISAKVHDSWMATKRQMGFHGPDDGCAECQRSLNESALGGFRCERFHADLIPYEQLTDAKKELDRATVRTVLKAMSELASLPVGESRWISVEEKLPELQQHVLFYAKDSFGEWRVLGGKYTDHPSGFATPGIGYGNKPEHVSHWMPSPEPPELGLGESREPLPTEQYVRKGHASTCDLWGHNLRCPLLELRGEYLVGEKGCTCSSKCTCKLPSVPAEIESQPQETGKPAFRVVERSRHRICHCGAWNTLDKRHCYMCHQPLLDDGKHFMTASDHCRHCFQKSSQHNKDNFLACPVTEVGTQETP